MLMEDYYTKDEIAHMCWYYGQYSDNLTYNMRAILVEKYEDMIGDKVEEIIKKRSWNENKRNYWRFRECSIWFL